jgi:hypothetical protein
MAISYFYHQCDKIPDRNNLREERFVVAHGFRGFSPWLLGLMCQEHMSENVHHLIMETEKGDRGRGQGKT